MSTGPRVRLTWLCPRVVPAAGQTLDDPRPLFAWCAQEARDRRLDGVLTATPHLFFGLAEGAEDDVEAHRARLAAHPALKQVEWLSRMRVNRHPLRGWTSATADRLETPDALRQRVELLRHRLAQDRRATAADFMRFLLSPSIQRADAHGDLGLRRVVLAGPSALWGPELLHRTAAEAHLRPGRTWISSDGVAARRTLVEYVDLPGTPQQPVRLVSCPEPPAGTGLASVLFEAPAMLTLLVSASDLGRLALHAQAWADHLTAAAGRMPDVLVLGSVDPARMREAVQPLSALAGEQVAIVRTRLHDGDAFAIALDAMLERQADIPVESRDTAPACDLDSRWQAMTAPAPAGEPTATHEAQGAGSP